MLPGFTGRFFNLQAEQLNYLFVTPVMRLWSIHPKYLDTKGLVAVWREGLLAKAVLEGNTRGYINHPQLTRFQGYENPINAINLYLWYILEESKLRGYNFDDSKIDKPHGSICLNVTDGQLYYESRHLLKKLKIRSPIHYNKLLNLDDVSPHPIFTIIPGPIEDWEKV